jgi:Icc-related predicted phosphoesterase
MTTYNFDSISDIHLDFYIDVRNPEQKMRKKIKEFVTTILPEKPQKVLVIAGDLGHYNHQNLWLLEELKNHYDYIILVSGNHDYYLVSSSVKSKYKANSHKRNNEMREMASKIDGVHYLDGNIIEIDGVKYGGVGMWYDFSYGIKYLGLRKDSLFYQWRQIMNDSKLISGLDMFHDFKEAEIENAKLDPIIDECDVVITHVGPDWSRIPHEYKFETSTAFYYFDGSKYFDKIDGKVWIYGHVHYRNDYDLFGCRMVNSSLGYPSENNGRKIININSEPILW